MKKRNWMPIGILLALGLAYGLAQLIPEKTPNMREQAVDARVRAEVLFEHFQADEAAAQARYAGKVLVITGQVASLDSTPSGQAQIRLASGHELGQITCSLSPNDAKALPSLRAGQEVVIKGRCAGFLFDLIIEPAMLLQLNQEPPSFPRTT